MLFRLGGAIRAVSRYERTRRAESPCEGQPITSFPHTRRARRRATRVVIHEFPARTARVALWHDKQDRVWSSGRAGIGGRGKRPAGGAPDRPHDDVGAVAPDESPPAPRWAGSLHWEKASPVLFVLFALNRSGSGARRLSAFAPFQACARLTPTQVPLFRRRPQCQTQLHVHLTPHPAPQRDPRPAPPSGRLVSAA